MLGKKLFFKIFFRFYCEEQKSHCGSKKKALPLHSTDLTRTLSQEKGVESNHLLIACRRGGVVRDAAGSIALCLCCLLSISCL